MNSSSSPNNIRFGLLMAVATALSWSVLAIALKFSLGYASAVTIVGFRFIVATLCLLTAMLFIDRPSISTLKSPPLGLVFGAVCLAINYIGYMKGVELTTASNAQIFIQIAPMGLLVVGILHFKERFSSIQGLGLALAAVGFFLFFRDQILTAWQFKEIYLMGNLWILISAISWIAYAVLNKKFSNRVSTNGINLLTYAVCALIFLPVIDYSIFSLWSPAIWVLMVALGLNTLLAYGCLSLAIKHAPASKVSAIITCNPIGTLLIMLLVDYFNVPGIKPEPVGITGYLGALAVISGVGIAIINSGASKKTS